MKRFGTVYGDYISIRVPVTTDEVGGWVDELADQMKRSLAEIYKNGLPADVLGLQLGWKVREVTELDRGAAEQYLEELGQDK